MNYPSPVPPDHAAPVRFAGDLVRVTITLGDADPAAGDGLWQAALRRQQPRAHSPRDVGVEPSVDRTTSVGADLA